MHAEIVVHVQLQLFSFEQNPNRRGQPCNAVSQCPQAVTVGLQLALASHYDVEVTHSRGQQRVKFILT